MLVGVVGAAASPPAIPCFVASIALKKNYKLINWGVLASTKQQLRIWQGSAVHIGGVGQAAFTSLGCRGDPSSPFAISSSDSRRPPQEEERRSVGGQGKRALSGSDVLFALQRAAMAQSQKGKRAGTGSRRRKGSTRNNSGRQGMADDTTDYSNVRPLRINGDWGVRLDDLERRLQELQQGASGGI